MLIFHPNSFLLLLIRFNHKFPQIALWSFCLCFNCCSIKNCCSFPTEFTFNKIENLIYSLYWWNSIAFGFFYSTFKSISFKMKVLSFKVSCVITIWFKPRHRQMLLSISYHQILNFQNLTLRTSFQHLLHISKNLSFNLLLTFHQSSIHFDCNFY